MARPYKLLLALILFPSVCAAASVDDEISFLLSSIDRDDCTFIRNDMSYSSSNFQDHLRSKLDANEQLISSAEDFIEKIATRSAVSDSPYVAVCQGELRIIKDWLAESLASYRQSN